MALEIPGYQINEQLDQSSRSIIHLAIRKDDGTSIAIKTLRNEYPSRQEIARFQHEYQIQHKLDIPGVAQVYGMEEHGGRQAMLLEYVDGGDLSSLMKQGLALPLDFFFTIAIQLAQTIGELHQHYIIHKDIKPKNILWDPKKQKVKIIDFGIATELSRERQSQDSNILKGSIAYISPEQTGRMNRSIDYRTDFYSLGITFYELLTGQLPFEDNQDTMGMIHCHIARAPEPVHQINPSIPSAVSALIDKLMAKNAEDRYKSAFGLKNDLETCRSQWLQDGAIIDFIPGQHDVSDRFEIPQKLYGRENEIAHLLQSFKEVAEGDSKILLVGGYSGIGKSALINEVHKSIVAHHGYFIEGKFDQFQRNIPYSAIAQAFRGLMRQLLSEPAERLEKWKASLLEVLGPNAQVLIDLIPELEQVVGPHPAVPHLGTDENQNRFNQVFLHFLQLFTKKEHPLVLFIDDLQWVDSATLNLLKLFTMESRHDYFLFLGAYRDNEVDPHHPFIQTIEEIRQADIDVPLLTLTPLELEHVNQLVAETISVAPMHTQPLAQLVHDKTDGNPFFVNQFLKNIYESQQLTFNIDDKAWHWELDAIQRESSSSNVVELMVAKIGRLAENTRHLLRLGACIGNRFNLSTLAIISEHPVDEVAQILWQAVKVGLLVPEDENHALLKETGSHSNLNTESFPTAVDRFLHDRVQQAAYSLIEEDQRRHVHLEIGRLLLQETTEQDLEADCFDIVEHYNKGIDLVEDSDERQRIAELNLLAGQRAKEATAYQPALQYFTLGIDWLAEDSASISRLRFDLSKGQIECHFLLNEVEEGISMADNLLKQYQQREDQVEINNILILYYGGAGQMDKAIDIALDSLRLYGIDLSRNPTQPQLLMELARAKLRLRNKSRAHLLAMPKFQDSEIHAVFSLLKELVAPTYLQGLNNLLPYILLRMFNLTLKYGNGPVASFAYSGYALLWAKLDDFPEAHRFGVIAMEYNKQVDNPPMEARCYFMATSFALYWKQPLKDSQEPRRIGLQKLIDTGEYFWASYIYLFGFWQEVALSKNLDSILDFTNRESIFADRAGQVEPFHVHTLHHNLFRNLSGQLTDQNSLDNQDGDEAKAIAYFKQNVTSTMGRFYHAVTRLVLSFFYDDFEQAATIALQADLTEEVIRDGTFTRVVYSFYSCLALLNAQNKPYAQKGQYSCKLYANLKKKIKRWFTICPENFACIWHLLLAEEARIEAQNGGAIEHYNHALRAAQAMDSFWFEALSNELFGRYWLSQDNHKVSTVYLGEARYFYYRWGAIGKVKQMEQLYPQLLEHQQAASANLLDTYHPEDTYTGTTTSGKTSSTSKESLLDIETLAKASQTLAGELQIDRLQQKLMQFLIENAGAQRGLLILTDGDKLTIEAQTSVAQVGELQQTSIPLEQADNLATAVVLFVARSKELVVLSDAANVGAYSNDPYITNSQTKSLLCLPLIDKNKLVGILYLENNLTIGAFTPDRVSILKVLSAEIAITLENARLYHNLEETNRTLEQRVEERTQELHGINEQLLYKNREIQESKQVIEAKNAAITSSIVYAQRIQQALLPTDEKIAESFQEFFVLYRPKQIVSGDFYWFSKLGTQVFLAVVDCTGHGVPGALLSMIGGTLLNKIINENQISSPALILEHLHIEVRHALKQQGQKRQQNDGMDIVLCRIDPAQQQLVFAGAKRPLYLAKGNNGKSSSDSVRELLEIRGDRKSIGGRQKEAQRTFTDHQVIFDSGDMIYLLSDGFTDQQDQDNQKFGSTQLEALLNEIALHDVPTQHKHLISRLEQHQGDENQRDDITLVGVRLP